MLRTKVVCTLGPASFAPETVVSLVRGGMDMARINMSHGSHETHAVAIDAVRAVNAKPDDGRCAIKHMQIRGVRFGETDEILRQFESK